MGGCVLSVINPLIAPMTLVYFIITGITQKYSLLYTQRPSYASGGKVRILFQGTEFRGWGPYGPSSLPELQGWVEPKKRNKRELGGSPHACLGSPPSARL